VKWSRRHKPLVGSAVAVLVLAVVGLAIGMVLLARKQTELEQQRDAARQAVDDMYTDVAEQWLAQQPALEPVQRTFLQKALDYYQRFAGEENTDPKVRLKTAAAYRRVGVFQQNLGRSLGAESAFHRAITILQKLVDDTLVPENRKELANSHYELGVLLSTTGREKEAEQEYGLAIALFEKLVADSPSAPEYQRQIVHSGIALAKLRQAAGRTMVAKEALRRAIAPAERLINPDSQNDLSWTLANFPEPCLRNPQLALYLAKKAVEQTPRKVGHRNTLGVAHYRAGDWKAAIAELEKSMELGAGGGPADWFFLAMAHWRNGETDLARQWYDKAVTGTEKHDSHDEEMRRFRAEVAALLGLADQPKRAGRKEENPTREPKP